MNPCRHAALIRQFSDELHKLADATDATDTGRFPSPYFAGFLHELLPLISLETGVARRALEVFVAEGGGSGSAIESRLWIRGLSHLARRWRQLGESFRRELLLAPARCCTELDVNWRESPPEEEADIRLWAQEASNLTIWANQQFRDHFRRNQSV